MFASPPHITLSTAAPATLCAALLLLLGGASAAGAQAAASSHVPIGKAAEALTAAIVPDTAAARYVGREVTVEGTVARVKPSRHHQTTYLNFGADYPNHTFSVVVPDSALAQTGGASALAALAGKRVRATGTVWLQDGKWPAMTVLDSTRLTAAPAPPKRTR